MKNHFEDLLNSEETEKTTTKKDRNFLLGNFSNNNKYPGRFELQIRIKTFKDLPKQGFKAGDVLIKSEDISEDNIITIRVKPQPNPNKKYTGTHMAYCIEQKPLYPNYNHLLVIDRVLNEGTPQAPEFTFSMKLDAATINGMKYLTDDYVNISLEAIPVGNQIIICHWWINGNKAVTNMLNKAAAAPNTAPAAPKKQVPIINDNGKFTQSEIDDVFDFLTDDI